MNSKKFTLCEITFLQPGGLMSEEGKLLNRMILNKNFNTLIFI